MWFRESSTNLQNKWQHGSAQQKKKENNDDEAVRNLKVGRRGLMNPAPLKDIVLSDVQNRISNSGSQANIAAPSLQKLKAAGEIPAKYLQPATSLIDLLERAGFHIRGRRADCIHCEGHARLTVSFSDEVAFCHRCKWTANVRILSRELGIAVKPETQEQRERRKRRAEFAEWLDTLYLLVIRRLRYLSECAELGEDFLTQFPDCEDAWDLLADLYHNEAHLFAALDILAFEKLSPWLEVPMTREKLFNAFDEARARVGIVAAIRPIAHGKLLSQLVGWRPVI